VELEKRFWRNVKKTETCWIWTSRQTSDGYGHLKINGKERRAHRVAWELCIGIIPKYLLVCHRCDVPLCVNPAHLFLGTNGDNVRDSIAKGRWGHDPSTRIQKENYRKVGREEVKEIRQSGESNRILARRFRISNQQISKIKLRQQWKWVDSNRPSGEDSR